MRAQKQRQCVLLDVAKGRARPDDDSPAVLHPASAMQASSDLGVVGAQVALTEQVAPVAVEAVLLVDEEHVRLVLLPGLLQHVRDRVLVPQPAVVLVAGRCQPLLQDLRRASAP